MTLFNDLIDLVLPTSCVCCGQPGALWCAGCQPPSVVEPAALAQGPPTVAAGEYAEELRTALLHYKERGQRRLAPQLADYLADAADVAIRSGPGAGSAALVPVPSRRSAARSRGGDHILRLARSVGRHLGLPVLSLLSLTGPVADSAGLNPAQRRANLTGHLQATAPSARASPRPAKIILLDDIVTTGATLDAAERALRAAGWPAPAAAVIAATRLRTAQGRRRSGAPD